MNRFAKLFFTIGMVAILTACGETQENTGVIVEGETVTQAGAAVTEAPAVTPTATPVAAPTEEPVSVNTKASALPATEIPAKAPVAVTEAPATEAPATEAPIAPTDAPAVSTPVPTEEPIRLPFVPAM